MSLLIRRHLCQITDILYELVTQALGGKSVKCVLNDDECIFTSDIETLLSSLDTEHPEIEIVLQSLKSHKAQYGEGIKSFLFMVTRISKAMKQLEQLGIAHCVSTSVMQEAIDMLTKEVYKIGLPLVTSSHETHGQSLFKEGSVVISKLPDRWKENLKQDESEVIGQLRHRSEDSHLECSGQQYSGDGITFEADMYTQSEINGSKEKSKFLSLMACTKEKLEDSGSFVVEPFVSVAESDIVYLKMSKCLSNPESEQGCDVDNVEWFFDKQMKNAAFDNEYNDLQNMERSLNMISQKLRGSGMNAVKEKNSLHKELHSDFPVYVNMNNGNGEHESFLNSKQDSHDSDFEDCFDDFNNQEHSTKKKGLGTKLIKDLEESSHISHSLSESSCQIEDDEFDECFNQDFKQIDKGSSEQIKSSQLHNEIVNNKAPELSKWNITQSHIHKAVTNENLENRNSDSVLQQTHSLNRDTPTVPAIAKLNSLLAQIGNKKTCNVRQVLLSTRHDLKRENSEDCVNLDASNLTNSSFKSVVSDENHTERIGVCNDIEKDPDACFQFSKTNQTGIALSQSKKLGASKIGEINAILKRFNARNPSVNLAGIVASSRHMENSQKSQQQNEAISLNSIHSNSSKPEANFVHQNFDRASATGLVSKLDDKANKSTIQDNESEKKDNECFDDTSAICHNDRDNAMSNFELANAQEVQIPENISYLCRDSDDLTQLITQIYNFQSQDEMAGNQVKRLDLSKVHCVSVQSTHCVKEVVKGLVVPCSDHTLQMIGTSAIKRTTLLVNGDLKSGFVHKGYRPVIVKKVVIAGEAPIGDSSDGQENLWALKAMDVLRKLSVNVLLVKGRVGETLSDMLGKENIAVLANVPFRVLQIISHTHKVTPIIYIQDAAMSDLCQLSYQPIDKSWMDHDGDSHCMLISDLPQIQTVVLQLPSTQSCHVEEERIWKCLHRLSHALKDGLVLPGYGLTELWCHRQIKAMTQEKSGKFCPQTDSVLRALADVFQDYVSFARLNVKSANGNYSVRNQHTSVLCHAHISNPDHMAGLKECNGLSSSWLDDYSIYQLSGEEHKEEGKMASHENRSIGHSIKARDMIFKRDEVDRDDGDEFDRIYYSKRYKHLINETDFSLQNIFHCDSFTSKVFSWSSALDLVKVLLSLDSLVVTGASSSDLGIGDVLL